MIEPDGHFEDGRQRSAFIIVGLHTPLHSPRLSSILRVLGVWIICTVFSSFLLTPALCSKESFICNEFLRNDIDLLLHAGSNSQHQKQSIVNNGHPVKHCDQRRRALRLLYVVTSSNKKRWNDLILPVLKMNVESLMGEATMNTKKSSTLNSISHLDVHVDLYLILSYSLEAHEKQQLRSILHENVGIEIWSESSPYKYKCNDWGVDQNESTNMTASLFLASGTKCLLAKARDWETRTTPFMNETRLIEGIVQLARQHRFVIKDKMEYYDYFLAWEDDMVVRRSHLDQHVKVMDMIYGLRRNLQGSTKNKLYKKAVEEMALSADILLRMRPGFIRTEVLQPIHGQKGTREDLLEELISKSRNGNIIEVVPNSSMTLNSSICCDIPDDLIIATVWQNSPSSKDLIVWESSPLGFALRKWGDALSHHNHSASCRPLPYEADSWIAAMTFGLPHFPATWMGNHHRYYNFDPLKHKHSDSLPPLLGRHEGFTDYIAQAAGWLGSKREVFDFHTKLCSYKGSFLPPYDPGKHKLYYRDGLEQNVEGFSGGIQMYGDLCRVQRVVSLESPDDFSRHLIYHASNNKQNQMKQHRLVKADTLWSEMHGVKTMLS